MSFRMTSKAASADTVAASNFIPEFKKMVKVGVGSPKQVLNVDSTVYHTTC
jgi:hypothetical protein